MIFKPKFENCSDVNKLAVIGDNVMDEFTKNKIRIAMVDKLLKKNYSFLYVINKFMNTDGILKEAYADLIMMMMRDNDYYIDDVVRDDVIRYASFEGLCYGADSMDYEFAIKCKDENFRRGMLIEDKIELRRKMMLKDMD